MTDRGSTAALALPARFGARVRAVDAAALGPLAWTTLLPFALVAYLALEGGGYSPIVRGEVGIVAWWVIVLGLVVGSFPLRRLGAAAWVGLGLLCAFAVWTALGISWSDSAERSVDETARVLTLLGVFAVALLTQGRDGLRRTLGAVAAAIALVGVLALLSRLQPGWFPDDATVDHLSNAASRLNYPLNYWNGLAGLIAVGVPLLLTFAVASSRITTRALAAAALPALSLAAFLTLSRAGAAALALGVLVLALLWPRRLAALPTFSVAAAASAILIAAANQRDALTEATATQLARSQGGEMLAMTIVVCAGVALIVVALGLAARYEVGPRLALSRPSRRATALGGGAAVALLAIALAASGASGELRDGWAEFKRPGGPGVTTERFTSLEGSGRYQFWETAVDANATSPLVGIGPGTYEYFWAENGTRPGFVRDAHSLFLETLAELGLVGLALLALALGWILAVCLHRAVTASKHTRMLLAGALGALAAFLLYAAVDWAWELTVLPVAFMLIAAAALAEVSRGSDAHGERPRPSTAWLRAVGALAAGAALIAIAIPLASAQALRASEAAAAAGDPNRALEQAREAQRLQPYAAAPLLQEAMVLELRGRLGPAAEAAREATDAEPVNWRNWLVLSRIEAQRGRVDASLRAYRRARSLNPRSAIFQR